MTDVVVVGSANVDVVLPVRRIPRPGETVLASGLSRGPGGKGANQGGRGRASCAATAFVVSLGDDDGGALLRDAPGGAGVDLSLRGRSDPDRKPRSSPSTSPARTRSRSRPRPTPSWSWTTRRQPRSPRPPALAQLEILLDTVAGGPRRAVHDPERRTRRDPRRRAAGQVDLLVVNEHEAGIVSGLDADPATTGTALLDRVPAVVVTLGGEGALVLRRGAEPEKVPGFSVQVVDTTAAGDTFCGVLAATLARGADSAAAVRRANAAAAPRRRWPPARSRPFPPRRRSTRCSGDPGPAGTAADRSSRCGLGSEHAAAHRGRRRRGAGPNGLVAATTLADAGWDVLVLEATGPCGRSCALGQRGRLGQRPVQLLLPARCRVTGDQSARPGIARAAVGERATAAGAPARPGRRHRRRDRSRPGTDGCEPGRGASGGRHRVAAAVRGLPRIREPFLSALLTSWPPVVPGARLARRLGSLGELARFARFMALPAHRMGQELFGGMRGRSLLAGNAMHADTSLTGTVSGTMGWQGSRCSPRTSASRSPRAAPAGWPRRWRRGPAGRRRADLRRTRGGVVEVSHGRAAGRRHRDRRSGRGPARGAHRRVGPDAV